jgi:hypothetical protein
LDGSHIYPRAEPASGSGIAEAMEVLLGGVEFRSFCDGLAEVMQEARARKAVKVEGCGII